MLPGHRWGTAPEKKAAPGGGNPSLHIAAGTGAGKFYLAAHPFDARRIPLGPSGRSCVKTPRPPAPIALRHSIAQMTWWKGARYLRIRHKALACQKGRPARCRTAF